MDIQRYSIGLVAGRADGEIFTVSNKLQISFFRPQKLFANVKELCVAEISDIEVGGMKVLFGTIDLYTCSIEHSAELDRKFIEEHGLKGLSDDALDAYLDEHEMTMPSESVGRLDLPTLKRDIQLKVSGRFLDKCPADFVLAMSVHGAGVE